MKMTTRGMHMTSKWVQDFGDFPYDQEHIEMNNKIIEALGWHVEKLSEPEIISVDPGTPGYPPEGGQIVLTMHVVDEAGEAVSDNWSSEGNCWEHCPQPPFCQDLNVALLLIHGLHLELSIYPDGSVGAEIHHEGMRYLNGGTGPDTPAMAVCKAWLSWHRHTQ